MNTLTHLAAGAVVAQAVLAVRMPRAAALVTGVVAGALSHLALDALPHYNWIVYLSWFHGVPFHWLIREAVCALPVAIIAMWLGRDRWVVAGLVLVGSMYPDFEKVAYVDFHIARPLVMFPSHSLQLSGHTCGWPRPALVGLEVGVLVALLAVAVWLATIRVKSPA